MSSAKPELASPTLEPLGTAALADHVRSVVVGHGERILAEIPKMLRRVGLFLVVASITVPLFFAGLLVVLWHLGH
jgi:hypothetical protein